MMIAITCWTPKGLSVKPFCPFVSHIRSHFMHVIIAGCASSSPQYTILFWPEWRMKLSYGGPWHVAPAHLQPVSTLAIRLETKIQSETVLWSKRWFLNSSHTYSHPHWLIIDSKWCHRCKMKPHPYPFSQWLQPCVTTSMMYLVYSFLSS